MKPGLKKVFKNLKKSFHRSSSDLTTTTVPTQQVAANPATSQGNPQNDPAPASSLTTVPLTPAAPDQALQIDSSHPEALMPPTLTPTRLATDNFAWGGLQKLMELITKLSRSTLEPLQPAICDVHRCIEVVSRSRQNYKEVRDELNNLIHDLCEHFGNEIPPAMTPSIISLARGIEVEILFVMHKQQQTRAELLVGGAEDANDIVECQNRVRKLLERLELNANLRMWRIVDEIATENRLKSLKISAEAKHRSAESASLRRVGCTPNTRTEVLEDLHGWACAQSREKIYWLNGMAGTGKTTIAYSFCEDLKNRQKLAASFFCSRQLPSCRNVNRIIPTIAYQLALFSRPFRHAASTALQDLDIDNQLLPEQFDSLVAKPLRTIQRTLPENVVIVIDALDECEDHKGVETILDILLSHAQHLPIKFFVASRPDTCILSRMRNEARRHLPAELRLHELDKTIVQDDIRLYFMSNLKSVSRNDLEVLATRSGVLFIYAATVVRYIESGGPARRVRRLKQLLGGYKAGDAPIGSDKEIDTLYTKILDLAINDSELDEKDREEMKLVLYTIICAQEPLTIDVLAGLLNLNREHSICPALDSLLSVLQVSGTMCIVNTLHQSFPDYLLNRKRSDMFYCDAEEHHARLARICFHQIGWVSPPFNICKFESSYLLDKEVLDLDDRIKESISVELFYACRYWAPHLKLARQSNGLAVTLFEFLSQRLLLWMEIMNLKRCIRDGAGVLYEMKEWCASTGKMNQDFQKILQDAWEFMSTFSSSSAQLSTPHIYVSHLSFWLEHRPISKYYQLQGPRLVAEKSSSMSTRRAAPISIFNAKQIVRCVVYSPSGNNIASAGGATIHVWDARSGKTIEQQPEGHGGQVTSVVYSPDGAYIVSGSSDKTICIWNAQTGEAVGQLLKGHTSGVTSVAYSPDGAYIVSGSSDKTIRIWNTQNGEAVGQPLNGHTSGVTSVAYSPDGAYIVSGSSDKTIRIWNAQTGKAGGQPLKGHTDAVSSVAYSPDSAYIVSSSYDGTIHTWNAQTGKAVGQPLKGHTSGVTSVAYSPDGAYIVSGSNDKTICIWNAQTGKAVGQLLKGHTRAVTSVAYSPDGAYIVSGSNDKTICIWNAQTGEAVGQLLKGHTSDVTSVAYSPDSTYIVSGSYDETIRIWNAQTGKAVGQPLKGHTGIVSLVVYSPDGAYIVSSSYDGTIRIWNAQTGEAVGQPLEGHAGAVTSVAYSPDGAYIVSGSNDKTICIWNAQTGEAVGQPLEGHASAVTSVAYSPDSAYIVSGSFDKTICIWNAQTGEAVGQPLKGHTSFVTSVAYSPDGAYIVSSSYDGTICIWNAQTGEAVGQPLKGHTGAITSVAYSPDSAYIVSGSSDKTIRIWNAQTGETVRQPLKGHTSAVSSVAYSPDGAYIVSGSDDENIRVWALQSEEPVCVPLQLETHPNTIFNHPNSVDDIPCTKSHICNSDCQLSNHHRAWSLRSDGWLVVDSTKYLLWVPPELIDCLLFPQSVLLISAHGFVCLEFNSNGVNKVGDCWAQYFQPQTLSGI